LLTSANPGVLCRSNCLFSHHFPVTGPLVQEEKPVFLQTKLMIAKLFNKGYA